MVAVELFTECVFNFFQDIAWFLARDGRDRLAHCAALHCKQGWN